MKAMKRMLLGVLAISMVLTLAGRSEAGIIVAAEQVDWANMPNPAAFTTIPPLSAADYADTSEGNGVTLAAVVSTWSGSNSFVTPLNGIPDYWVNSS